MIRAEIKATASLCFDKEGAGDSIPPVPFFATFS